eukprot:TRINITY_DN7782_c0_g2_i1.p1 TRINITY_DN7782_c0_g2~~TRINITY_DN7782_c0_g2_i1.p1  ORF type:complete len:607 (+),score=130.93 TRINITY_DN7782_c0_g2_i1:51-1871(+)
MIDMADLFQPRFLIAAGVGALFVYLFYSFQSKSKSPPKRAANATPSSEASSSRTSAAPKAEANVASSTSASHREFVALESVDEMKPGTMKDVENGDAKILLVRTSDGTFSATSSKCTHYAAPLSKGVLCGDRVVCPWHAASFNCRTGDIEDAPALDALQCFSTQVSSDGKVVVRVPVPFPPFKREFKAGTPKQFKQRTIVVVGGGASGFTCCQTLREEGYTGKVIMISNEEHLPYDRIKISKGLNLDINQVLLRQEPFFKQHNIDFLGGQEVTKIDTSAKEVVLANRTTIPYDSVLVATGGVPRTLPCEGKHLGNIFTVRNIEDSTNMFKASENIQNVVIVGSSFIGMEMAALLKQSRKIPNIYVIGMEKVPFERVLGPKLGYIFQQIHEQRGIQFRMGRVVSKFVGETVVKAVVLDDGEEIPADMVVIGAGIIPSTKLLSESGIPLERDGSVIVNQFMQIPGHDGVYAAGDIARFPYHMADHPIRVEHWDVAMQHGRVVARNMLGKQQPYDNILFFWTQQFGISIRYAGHAFTWDDIIIDGSTEVVQGRAPTLQAFFVKNDAVLAVATINNDAVAAAAFELFRMKKMPRASELKTAIPNLVALLN